MGNVGCHKLCGVFVPVWLVWSGGAWAGWTPLWFGITLLV